MATDRQTLQQRCRQAAAGGAEARRRFVDEHAPLIEAVLRREFREHAGETTHDAMPAHDAARAHRQLAALARRICGQMIDRLSRPSGDAERETVAEQVTRVLAIADSGGNAHDDRHARFSTRPPGPPSHRP